MLDALADPNFAFVVLIAGVLALYWELHAPGSIAPGVIGVFLLCAGAFGLWENTPTWYGSVLISIALLLLAVEVKLGGHGVSGASGAVLLLIGALAVLRGPRRINPALAVAVSIALCSITVFLGYLALRARRGRLLTGLQSLVGEVGVARTEISPHGTVLVRGEYWQAKSSVPIPTGTRVSIERVQGMTLYVKEA
jgi:membrane-bound serine protease (ClpP class)